MKSSPEKVPGVRLCLALTSDGVTAYGNREAFASLREWLLWLENSDEKDNFECHVTMSLEDDASIFEGKKPRNVWVLMSEDLSRTFSLSSSENPGFELTLMMVPKDALDEMERYQEVGILPEYWNKNS